MSAPQQGDDVNALRADAQAGITCGTDCAAVVENPLNGFIRAAAQELSCSEVALAISLTPTHKLELSFSRIM